MTSLLFSLSITLTSIGKSYLPSSLFLLPALRNNSFFEYSPLKKFLLSYTALIFLFALVFHLDTFLANFSSILKSLLVLLSIPFALFQGEYYLKNVYLSKGEAFVSRFFPLPLFISLVFFVPILAYEPSSIGRLFLTYVVLFVAIPICHGLFKLKRFLWSPIFFSLVIGLLANLADPPLSLAALFLFLQFYL